VEDRYTHEVQEEFIIGEKGVEIVLRRCFALQPPA